MFTISNEIAGKTFKVKILRKGDQYGLNKCLTHEDDVPLVEFYDAVSDHDPEGRFISRYSADSLLGQCKFSGTDITLGLSPLSLRGCNPGKYYLTTENCKRVGEWLHSEPGMARGMS
jgi:hypothetical protein